MNPPSTNTSLQCFATAIKLVVQAATVDTRIAPLVPKVSELFLVVSKNPKVNLSLTSDTAHSIAVSDTDPSATVNQLLIKTISVLSLAAPLFPAEVSSLIPLVIGYMASGEMSRFPSTEVDGETCAGTLDHNNNNHSLLELPTNVTITTGCSDSLSVSNNRGHDVLGDSKKRYSDISVAALQSASYESEAVTLGDLQDPNVKDSGDNMGATDADGSKVSGKRIQSVDSARSDSPSNSAVSSSSSSSASSRNNRAHLSTRKDFARIPKRQKTQQHYSPTINIVDYGVRDMFASGNDRNMAFSRTADETPLPVLIHRSKLWDQVTTYEPQSRCIPTESALAIVVTSDSTVLYEKYHKQNDCDENVAKFLTIKKVVLIPRAASMSSNMSYCISNLHRYQHGTVHLHSNQHRWFKEATKHLEVLVLKEGVRYDDADLGIHVQYTHLAHDYAGLSSLINDIAPVMNPNCSTARNVPSVSCGWSTANAHEYRYNRSNVLGSISPFLIDGGIDTIQRRQKEHIAFLIGSVIKAFSPCGIHPTPFFHSDPTIRQMRADFATEFLESLGSKKAKNERVDSFFLAEGVSFIFNNFVSFHTDTMNDPATGMNDTLSINCSCIISSDMASFASVKKAMKMFHLNVGDPLSFSVMVYSRKCIGDHIKKQLKIQTLLYPEKVASKASLPDLYWLISPLLKAIHRVDSDFNTNAVWDDHSVINHYMSNIKRDPSNTQYQGDYIELVAGFDKMRYWSPVRYLADALHARNIIEMTPKHLMGYICFASLETNGTFLLSGIIDDILAHSDPNGTAFMRDFEKYGLYAALIFAAQEKNKGTGTGTVYGSSKNPRHQHHNRGSCERFPVAGGKGLLSFDEKGKDDIANRCASVVSRLLEICRTSFQEVNDVVSRRRRGDINGVAHSIYESVMTTAGPGVAHIFTLNFMQVASMFGFFPLEIITWACVGSKTSGAYKAINALYKQHQNTINGGEVGNADLSLSEAEKYFTNVVTWISSNVSYNFTPSVAENMLCELNREKGTIDPSEEWAPSNKSDVLYLYKHRNNTLHHLYRWKTDTKGKAILQVLLMSTDGKVVGTRSLFEMASRAGSRGGELDFGAYWTGGYAAAGAVQPFVSKYKVTAEYAKYFV